MVNGDRLTNVTNQLKNMLLFADNFKRLSCLPPPPYFRFAIVASYNLKQTQYKAAVSQDPNFYSWKPIWRVSSISLIGSYSRTDGSSESTTINRIIKQMGLCDLCSSRRHHMTRKLDCFEIWAWKLIKQFVLQRWYDYNKLS